MNSTKSVKVSFFANHRDAMRGVSYPRDVSIPLPSFVKAQSDGVLLSVKLQPRASNNAVAKPQGDELRVKVTAPPVDSAANEALLRLLADLLGCGRNRIELVRGGTSRHKVIKVYGVQAEEILRKLAP